METNMLDRKLRLNTTIQLCVEEKEREKRVKRGPQLIEKGSFEVEF